MKRRSSTYRPTLVPTTEKHLRLVNGECVSKTGRCYYLRENLTCYHPNCIAVMKGKRYEFIPAIKILLEELRK